ncbi:MAG: hypothetical protein Q4A70_00320 [Candidatus Saccharibacteria bacterium]|nr:hypothetical protein [Candidatus Saccharibacteria bacterium]
MSKNKRDIMFLCLFCSVMVVGLLTFVKTQNTLSTIENRTLTTFSHFTIHDFWNGSFQDNFEAAISDQFIGSSLIRLGYSEMLHSLPTFGLEDRICKDKYLELAGSVDRRRATFDCEDYILYWPEELSENKKTNIVESTRRLSHLNELSDVYYYFVNDSSVYDFEKKEKVVDYYALLGNYLKGDYSIGEFDYKDYSGYKDMFYKTDHHWNYKGSYCGYMDIVNLLGINSPNNNKTIKTNHEPFFGSGAQSTNNYTIEEEFSYYVFDLPEHDTFINGKVGKRGHFEEYQTHDYNYDRTTNYYAYLYGGDEGEIRFDYHQPKKENLLMFVNSYSNPIDELIASHFNKTYIIDLRHYKQFMGKDFDLKNYISEKKINKVLVIMSPTFLTELNNSVGLEG